MNREKVPVLSAAPLWRRLCALVYEGLLLAAVTAVAAIPAGLVAMVLNRVSVMLSSLVVMLVLLYAWWLYYKFNGKKGQTLPMKVWKIGLANVAGYQPPLGQVRLRFIWAVVWVVFVPLFAYAGLRHGLMLLPSTALPMALLWWILPWGFAFLNRDKQFLYDYLAGTRLVDMRD